MTEAIPRVIHQLWIGSDVPERYVRLRASWARFNPGWEMRLWTDADLLALVETRYPGLLAIYRGYRRNISRADLGRYLVLHAFGGVYADLDCECLRSLAPLLDGASFVIGLEPASHAAEQKLAWMISAAFIASAPGHAFWPAVFERIRERAGDDHVLYQTGPILLNETYEALPNKASVRLLPPALLHPFTAEDCWSGRVYDLEFWEQTTREAFVAHYWDGTWHRTIPAPSGLPFDIPTTVNAVGASGGGAAWPRISCLMASSGRMAEARGAIDDFTRQTYANRELIIGAAAFEPALEAYVAGLGRTDIRLITGEAGWPFDDALLAAGGEVVCGWAADIAHDPRRLEVQQRIRSLAAAAACLGRRQVIWRPASGQIGITASRPIADTALAAKAALEGLTQGADETAWLRGLYGAARVATFDLPRLTLRLDTAADPAAFEAVPTRFAPERTAAVLHRLAERLAIDPEGGARAAPAPERPPIAPEVLILPLSDAQGPIPPPARNRSLLAALRRQDWVLWLDDGVLVAPDRLADLTSRGGDVIELETVRGPALLVRADLHREGLLFPAEGGPQADLSAVARAMGHGVTRVDDPTRSVAATELQ